MQKEVDLPTVRVSYEKTQAVEEVESRIRFPRAVSGGGLVGLSDVGLKRVPANLSLSWPVT